jgi:hypothetical protein
LLAKLQKKNDEQSFFVLKIPFLLFGFLLALLIVILKKDQNEKIIPKEIVSQRPSIFNRFSFCFVFCNECFCSAGGSQSICTPRRKAGI